MAESFWESEKTIAEVPKNERGEVIAIKLVSKGKRQYVDVRTFYTNKAGDLAPGKGIALPLELAEEIAGHVLSAAESAKED